MDCSSRVLFCVSGTWWIWASVCCVRLLMIVGESGVLELGGSRVVRVFRLVTVGKMGESLGLGFMMTSVSWETGSVPQETTFLPLTEGGVEVFFFFFLYLLHLLMRIYIFKKITPSNNLLLVECTSALTEGTSKSVVEVPSVFVEGPCCSPSPLTSTYPHRQFQAREQSGLTYSPPPPPPPSRTRRGSQPTH